MTWYVIAVPLLVLCLGCSSEKDLNGPQNAEDITLRSAYHPKPFGMAVNSERKRNIVCQDHQTQCPDDYTCCIALGGYLCCPLPEAVCCGDGINCCPSGYICDFDHGGCRRGESLTRFHKN